MALIVVCLVWESITSLMRGAKFWESWENTKYPKEDRNGEQNGQDQGSDEKNAVTCG
jgi:hypothetical protein